MNHSRNTSHSILFLVQAAMIAALYIVLTALAAGFDLASGAIQVRFSEVLTVLPFFTPAAVPGALWFLALTVGAGEVICCVIFGGILISVLLPHKGRLFPTSMEEKSA